MLYLLSINTGYAEDQSYASALALLETYEHLKPKDVVRKYIQDFKNATQPELSASKCCQDFHGKKGYNFCPKCGSALEVDDSTNEKTYSLWEKDLYNGNFQTFDHEYHEAMEAMGWTLCPSLKNIQGQVTLIEVTRIESIWAEEVDPDIYIEAATLNISSGEDND